MIHPLLKKELADQLIKGDLPKAAKIYQKNTNRKIHRSMLERFIKNQHPFSGQEPDAHNPLAMFQAIQQAVIERQAIEREASQKAAELIKQIMRDTQPQPIAL